MGSFISEEVEDVLAFVNGKAEKETPIDKLVDKIKKNKLMEGNENINEGDDYKSARYIEEKLKIAGVNPADIKTIMKLIEVDYRKTIVEICRDEALKQLESASYWIKNNFR